VARGQQALSASKPPSRYCVSRTGPPVNEYLEAQRTPALDEPDPRCDQTDLVDIDEAADQLYALAPGDFIAARDGLLRQARESGDRELATAIAALRKPTAVAWLANRLARDRPEQLADFLALGPPLREASETLSGQALRDLSRQRQQLVAALVREARRVAASHPGPRVSEDVARGLETTLHAALADPAAAASLAAGRLSGSLSHTGFGAPATDGPAVAAPAPITKTATDAKKKTSQADRQAEKRARIETELAQAEVAARDAAQDRDVAAGAADEAEKSYGDAKARLGTLQDDLRDLQRRLADAERARDGSRVKRDRAADASRAAGRGAERAQAAVTDLQRRLASLDN
jgi:hypothetical protein